jgi:hypothetical protein
VAFVKGTVNGAHPVRFCAEKFITGIAVMFTVIEVSSKQLEVFAVRVIVNVPGLEYECEGFCADDGGDPSPKSQLQEVKGEPFPFE